jgi:putative heme-binding domain-containing protein
LDFDDHGQAFASTSVVDHFWHVIPGARWERWKDRGGHPDPYSYELMSSASDHLHWGGGMWDKNGRIAGANDQLGGGHSHSDAMIYLGDRWPQEFRGTVLMSNIHGRRINRDVIGRRAGGGPYVATHAADFITVDDPWFRAISLAYGPDGDVVMTDWSDHGECHDRDGVHRTSGRIYKISWGPPRKVEVDLQRETDLALVALQRHANDWFVRHARRLLQERALAGRDMSATHAALRSMLAGEKDATRKLRALWALHVTGGATPARLRELLSDPDEHLRHWAVRLLAEQDDRAHHLDALVRLADGEASWLVRLALASGLQRLAPGSRIGLAQALIARSAPDTDPNLVRMIWYGIHPEVAANPEANAPVGLNSRVPLLRRFTARRLADAMPKDPRAGGALLAGLASAVDRDAVASLLAGAVEGLKGAGAVPPPAGADCVLKPWFHASDPALRRLATFLAAAWGNADAVGALRREMNDPAAAVDHREAALAKLAELRPAWLPGDLIALLQSKEIAGAALRALPAFADSRVADSILAALPAMNAATRMTAIDALAARADSARKLLEQVALGKIDRQGITPGQARQVSQLGDPALTAQLEKVWGSVAGSAAATAATIARLKHQLAPATLLEANLARGAVVFEQSCAGCHRLFGRGQTIGPDLTGSGRKDLDYLLLNIVDPNASIPADYRLAAITLADGRVVSGSITSQSAESLVVRLAGPETTVRRAEVKSIEYLPVSLMPPGLLESMPATDVRDLMAYLMSDGVPPDARTP